VLVLILAGTFWYVTRPTFIQARLTAALTNATGTSVTLEHAQWHWPNIITIEGLSFQVPNLPEPIALLAYADDISMELDYLGFITDGVEQGLVSTTVDGLTIHITENSQTQETNFELLPERDVEAKGWPKRLPEVSIRAAKLTRSTWSPQQDVEPMGDVQVDVSLRADPEMPGKHTLMAVKHQEDNTQPTGLNELSRLLLDIDLVNRSLDMEVSGVVIETRHRQLLPSRVRQLWDQLDPTGNVPRIELSMQQPKLDEAMQVTALVQFDDVNLSLPIDPMYASRMEQVSGELRLIGDKVEIDELVGIVEGIEYQLNGYLDAQNPGSRFELTLSTKPFTLPESPEFVPFLPPAIIQTFDRLEPSGVFRLTANVLKQTADDPVTYAGTVHLMDARAKYADFPYPAERMVGKVHFNQDEVNIEKIDGQFIHGGSMTIQGTISPPGDGSRVKMAMSIRDVPVEQPLFDAIEPGQRKAIDLLMDQVQYQRLVDLDLLHNDVALAARRSTENGSPYYFTMGGKLNAEVDIDRPLGLDQQYTNTITINAKGMRGLYRYFPYPLYIESGTVSFNRNEVLVNDIVGLGPSGARARISGRLTGHNDESPITPELRITDMSIPSDLLLLHAIPETQSKWLNELNLTGIVEGQARIFRNEKGIRFDVASHTRDARADPFGAGLILEPLSAHVRIQSGGFAIEQAVAQCENARIELSGAAVVEDGQTSFDLSFQGWDLPIDARLAQLAPPHLNEGRQFREIYDKYQPEGQLDAELNVSISSEGTNYKLIMSPDFLQVEHRGTTLALDRMSGAARVVNNVLELDDVAGHYPTGRVSASGLIDLTGETGVTLSLDGDVLRFDPMLMAVLPKRVQTLVKALQIDGAWSTRSARFIHRPEPELSTQFEAVLNLDGARIKPGVQIENIEGQLGIRVDSDDVTAPPIMDLQLDAETMDILGREASPVHLRLNNTADREVLDFINLTGEMYGGRLAGDGFIKIRDPDQGYQVRLDLFESELQSIMQPDSVIDLVLFPRRELDDELAPNRRKERGVVTASLSLQGGFDGFDSLTGRGAMMVRDARLFRSPFSIGIIQSLNIAVPNASSFDRVTSEFLLDGNTVHIRKLTMETPPSLGLTSLFITGGGTMKLPSTHLNLKMVTRVQGREGLGQVGDAFNLLKDQLLDIRITGSLDDPVTRVVTFSGLQNTWNRLWGNAPTREPLDSPVRPIQ